ENTLILTAPACRASAHSLDYKAPNQFRRMVLCVMPDSWPTLDYSDYGCYCGPGGSGTLVDDPDRCCQVHGTCCHQAMQHPKCWPILDNPYTNLYHYSCDKKNRKVTCDHKNNECEMFICECDRKAIECFGRAPWLPEHEHLPSNRCQ
uniref:Phospholipase A2 n=1 Tax=Cyclopterus lumpus TaxID=8103 RepID=A0A8C2XP53_CYCLU